MRKAEVEGLRDRESHQLLGCQRWALGFATSAQSVMDPEEEGPKT